MLTYWEATEFVLRNTRSWFVSKTSKPVSLMLYEYYTASTEGYFRECYIVILLKNNQHLHPLAEFPPSLPGRILSETSGLPWANSTTAFGYILYLLLQYFNGNSNVIPDKREMMMVIDSYFYRSGEDSGGGKPNAGMAGFDFNILLKQR